MTEEEVRAEARLYALECLGNRRSMALARRHFLNLAIQHSLI